MLSGNDYGVNPLHLSVLVFDGYLTFSVRTKIGEKPRFSYFRELSREFMRKHDRHRHIFFRFVCGITEHHALIARAESIRFVAAFSVFDGIVHAEGDIRALLVNGCEYGASVAIEAVFCPVVADFAHGVSRYLLNIDIAVSGNFAHNENKPRRSRRFAGNSRHRVFC